MQRDGMKGKKALSGLCLAAAVLVIIWVSWRNGIVNYYLVSTLALLLSLAAFFLSYERKKPTAQELVLLAVLCAVAVVGRMAFAAVPFFKPAAAIVILTGIAFGGQAGCLCGAASMLVSNFFFGQGAWTPWQMLAFGVAGLLAGVECRAGRLLLGGAAGAASSLALLAPEAPDAAALLYKVSTAALTVAAAYGWPGGRCFARLVGWFCAGNLLLAGALLLPGAQTNNGCIYLPLSPGALLAGAGGVVLAVQGVLRFLGRGGGQVFPARLTVADTALDVRAFCDTGFSVQEPLSGRTVVLVRFGAVQSRLPPALGTYLEQHFAGAAPLPVPALGVRLVPCTTVAGHCILPAVPASLCCTGSPAGQARAEHLYAAFADLPPPPDGWEVLVGSETVSSLAHG